MTTLMSPNSATLSKKLAKLHLKNDNKPADVATKFGTLPTPSRWTRKSVAELCAPQPLTTPPPSKVNALDTSPQKRLVTEEVNADSIYAIYLKKITYSFNNSLNKQSINSNFVTRCDQIDYKTKETTVNGKSNSKWYDDQQVSPVRN